MTLHRLEFPANVPVSEGILVYRFVILLETVFNQAFSGCFLNFVNFLRKSDSEIQPDFNSATAQL